MFDEKLKYAFVLCIALSVGSALFTWGCNILLLSFFKSIKDPIVTNPTSVNLKSSDDKRITISTEGSGSGDSVQEAQEIVSISLVFLNKYLLSGDTLQLDAPMFVTWYQCVVCVFICIFLRIAAQHAPDHVSFPSIAINFSKLYQLIPLSLVFVGMITFNNLCLQHVGVAFYNVGRSLTTVFNVVLSYLILGQKTSPLAMGACGVIVLGFLMGVDQEDKSTELSYLGVFYGVMASCCVACYAIFTKKLLPVVDNNIWLLTYYNNINACVMFLPLMYMNSELGTLIAFPYIGFVSFWMYMNLAGILAVSIAYVTGLQIQVTSALTHNISGTAKACVQTILAVTFFHQPKSALWWLSNAMVLGGSAGYTRVKQLEMKKQHEVSSASSKDSPAAQVKV